MTTPDLSAVFSMCGNQILDMLLGAQTEDCRYPPLLVTDPDTIPDAIVRAALIEAVQRLDNR